MNPLETPPAPAAQRRERRWTFISLGAIALALVMAALAVNQLRKSGPPPAGPVDHGPVPFKVTAQALQILEQHLEDVTLEEQVVNGVREFHVKGRTRAGLAQDFYKGFKPAVANQLMPLLRPYGEVLSFDIASLDLPPARLRPLPSKD